MPVTIDGVFVVSLLGVASLYEHFYFWPRFRADVAAERPAARTHAYRRGVLGQWLLTIAAFAIWTSRQRPWAALRLTLPQGWRLALGLGFVLAAVALLALQLWSAGRLSPERRVAARPKLGSVAFMLPHTAREQRWFATLAITAGFCEELLYRGYLPWFFAPWLGPVGAMILVVAAFGLSHTYQGRKGAIKATLAGAVMAAIVLSTGSLIPAMIVHALIDIGGGTVGYWLLREQGQPQTSNSSLLSSEAPDASGAFRRGG
ncbi:MAG TPA: type II CAAX endopeptidase family protein [Gemmatimonadales bacterium]|nr:type II CAAX endopeptidase family protein [Gemmatimonadales bacterium]